MSDDPLIEGLYLHRALTPADFDSAIRYRQAKIRTLVDEITRLHRLLESYNEALDIRQERDPPIETPERPHH